MSDLQKCRQCSSSYLVRETDVLFYEKIKMPIPSLCPQCRMQRRMAHRNERYLYKRNCDFTKKNVISVYSSDKPYKVYDHEIWWSDRWNPKEYGQNFDFQRPFFEQFAELKKKVPRMNMMISTCENSHYAPYSVRSKNCYMCVSIVGSEDIYYSYQTNASKNCVDCSLCYQSELCYECIYGVNLYRCLSAINCRNSSDLAFCRDCQGCDRCIGCVNLRNKKLHIFNRQVTEKEYQVALEGLKNFQEMEKMKSLFAQFSLKFPVRENSNIQCENCVGDHLLNCKNSYHCFEAELLEDCAYVSTLPQGAKDSQDCHYSPRSELLYEAMSCVEGYNCQFVLHSWNTKNSQYVDECFYSHHLFGCIGLKRSEYCILNKQYNSEEYEVLLPRIVAHMRKTGEYGNYFPVTLSSFAYNESIASEFFPLGREDIKSRGWQFREDRESTYAEPTYEIPDEVREVPDDVSSEILACINCRKNYRIISQELAFYRTLGLPLPRLCPSCRHFERMKYRVARQFFERECHQCKKKIYSTLAPSMPDIVYCEDCYRKEVY